MTLASLLVQIGIDPESVAELDAPGGENILVELQSAEISEQELARAAARAEERVAGTGALLLAVEGSASDAALARIRNVIWPAFHVTAIGRVENGRAYHRTLSGERALESVEGNPRTLLVAHRRQWVQSPEATVEKFDKNAASWNGMPGSPGYSHFRWMRRYVGCFARPRTGERVLDFGCGAGWCGIEAARGVEGVHVSAFDPSPEMVRIAEENARSEGLGSFEARTGFGNDPPFPRGDEEPYDLVISSGVVSFAPDVEEFIEGVESTLRPGGTLVIGDINSDSRGFRSRRRTKPLLPVREMNACSAAEIRHAFESRGFAHLETCGYQLTWPIPEAMHLSETRLFGTLSLPLLYLNRALAGIDRALGDPFGSQFDSWVMRFTAPRLPGTRTPVPIAVEESREDVSSAQPERA